MGVFSLSFPRFVFASAVQKNPCLHLQLQLQLRCDQPTALLSSSLSQGGTRSRHRSQRPGLSVQDSSIRQCPDLKHPGWLPECYTVPVCRVYSRPLALYACCLSSHYSVYCPDLTYGVAFPPCDARFQSGPQSMACQSCNPSSSRQRTSFRWLLRHVLRVSVSVLFIFLVFFNTKSYQRLAY